jgi:hypothetical protein
MISVSKFIYDNRYDLPGLDVLIIGPPASGKTYVSNLIARECGYGVVIHTDDYLKHGNVESLYCTLADLELIPPPRIIEGVGGYRMLRKGVQMDCYYPDLVIELYVPDGQIEYVYRTQRKYEKLPHLKGFNMGLQSILKQYKEMPNARPPKWVVLDNTVNQF